jgi:UDP-N-acetylglucosamine--N-acetylmuramyl-(pentapeptide) pyrophosphoryl-undecaprenol N-acetylglucosamine transferase
MSTLLVMAGGTGGHVFPALAVAKNLRDRGVEVVWLGTRSGLEARTIPAAGFDIEWINIRGARGKGLLGWVRTPFLVLAAMVQTMGVVRRRRPGAMLGMGGFVAGPGGVVSWLLRRPLLIHEANALAGLTNQLLARIATRVMTGFPDTFGKSVKEEHVGNPVREEIAALAPPRERLRGRSGPLRVLVVGGSQGARALNLELPRIFGDLSRRGRDLEIRHQTGSAQRDEVERRYHDLGLNAGVESFIEYMAQAYEWADLVLCRAGAMTVAEVSAAGLTAVFVPFPHAAGDHQTANANYLAKRGAAYMVRENRLGERLPDILSDCHANREKLISIAENARALAKPDATGVVADICMESLSA